MRTALPALRCNGLLDIHRKFMLPSILQATHRRHSRAGQRPAAFAPPTAAAISSPTAHAQRRRLRGGALRQGVRQREAPARCTKLSESMRQRSLPAENQQGRVGMASDLRLPAMTISMSPHGCLTPAFSGAASGNQRTHEKLASRPPLQRLVRRALQCRN